MRSLPPIERRRGMIFDFHWWLQGAACRGTFRGSVKSGRSWSIDVSDVGSGV